MEAEKVARALASTERQGDTEISFSNTLYPLRFLGMGLLIAWLCCTHVGSIYPGIMTDVRPQSMFDVAMRFGDIGTFIILAFFAPRIGLISSHRSVNALAITVCSLGTAVLGFYLYFQGTNALFIAPVAFITGIGGALLFCLWAEAYCQMGGMRTIVYGAASCIAAAIVAFFISIVTSPYQIVLVAMLPVVSFVCVFMSFKILPAEQQRAVGGVRFPAPLKLLLLMGIAGLVSGFAGSLLLAPAADLGAIHRVQATGLAGVVILIMVFVSRARLDVRFLAKVVLPVSVLAFALIPFAGYVHGGLVSFLIKLAYVWFTFFVLLMLSNIVYRFEVPSLRLFAGARASSEFAILAGVSLRRELWKTDILLNDTVLYVIAVAGIVLLLVCMLLWLSEKSVTADWGASGVSAEDGMHMPGPREKLLERCEKLASQHNLTAREAEILVLIAQGRSRLDIEQELFLSQNTVKTHLWHLYGKLGLHSMAEVTKLFKDVDKDFSAESGGR